MCYLVRQQQPEAAEGTGLTVPPALDRLRSRWVGAAAATLVGGLALAAVLSGPQSSPPQAMAREGAIVPARMGSPAQPANTGTERALAPDDGVPTTPDTARAGAGPCHHGL
jgi:hypothetical protein